MRDEFVYTVITKTKFKLRYYLNKNNVFTITHHIYKIILTKAAMALNKNTKVKESAVFSQNSVHKTYNCEKKQNRRIQI
jgi:hypothetical protein